jgi:hypothetical protein
MGDKRWYFKIANCKLLKWRHNIDSWVCILLNWVNKCQLIGSGLRRNLQRVPNHNFSSSKPSRHSNYSRGQCRGVYCLRWRIQFSYSTNWLLPGRIWLQTRHNLDLHNVWQCEHHICLAFNLVLHSWGCNQCPWSVTWLLLWVKVNARGHHKQPV